MNSSDDASFSLVVDNEQELAGVATALAGRLMEGDVVLLDGDLAAGKTTFVKAVVAALDSTAPVTSPTFTLAQSYPSAAGPVLHMDAYRIESVEEFHDLGLEDEVVRSVTFVEWGGRVAAEFESPLVVEMSRIGPDERREMVFRFGAGRWADVAPGLRRDLEGWVRR